MIDYSLQEQSCRLSYNHMTALAIKERDYNFYKYYQNITTPTIQQRNCEVPDEELALWKGIKSDKKACIVKNPEYNSGEWEKQFQLILDPSIKFNFQSKNL